MDGVSAGKVDRNVAESAPSLLKTTRTDAHPTIGQGPARDTDIDVSRVAGTDSAQLQTSTGQERPKATREELEALTDNLNRVFEQRRGVRFDLSDDGNDLVVQVVDLASDEVVRTIPPERLAELHQQLGETPTGLILDDQA